MKGFPDTFTIVDTETTGMRPPFSRVIDIGILRVEKGKVVERFETLINPGISIPSHIRRFTDISDEDLANAPPFEDVALQVEALFKDSVFVAHNAAFDYAFIKSEFARLDIEFSKETLCSVRFSRALVPKARSHSLDSIIDRYGIALTGQRHRALPDAEAVWEFFSRVPNEHSPEEIARATMVARAGGTLPRVARDTFTDLPDSAGVYFFYGPEQELLYIGKSKHVRTRARSHFHTSANRKEVLLQKETNTISSVKTSGELTALLLESALIKTQSPLYNRALRKRKQLVTATAITNDQGYQTLQLIRTGDIDPAKGVHAIFRTMAQAKVALRTLAKEHELCPKLLGIEIGVGACFSNQLGICKGACVSKESVEIYNARFEDAFSKRKLRTWPYKGTLMITEKESEDAGTVLFVRDWVLLGAYRYEHEAFEPLFPEQSASDFDYDTYKILVRYLLHPRNKKTIQTLSDKEYERALARALGSTVSEYEYEKTID